MRRILFAVTAVVVCGEGAFAQKKNILITDPAAAAKLKDFRIQGEYIGDFEGGKIGAQIIALGGNDFEGAFYDGGLPGAGWSRGNQMARVKAKLKDGKIVFDIKKPPATATWENGNIGFGAEGKSIVLKKTTRKSATLGKQAPKGATILFSGKTEDASNWKGGKVKGGLLAAGTESLFKYGDATIHLEFRTPYKPFARGQGRGNSGVYVQGRYEIQVLDSFGLTGESNECGGIYKISKPLVNACFPPLSWQTYDINFKAAVYKDGKKVKNARVTVKHNGITIHKDLELPRQTPGKNGEADSEGILYLQGHGNPVFFRNVWIKKN